MEEALTAYINGEKRLNQCSREYNISKSTQLRHTRKTKKLAQYSKKAFGRNATFDTGID